MMFSATALLDQRMSHARRLLIFVLACGLLLTGCIGNPRTVGIPGTVDRELVAFDRSELVTGPALRQTVLTGFLLGGAVAELAVLHLDENDDRRLRIYSFDKGTWTLRLETRLRPGVQFVDVANLGGRDRLVTYEPGRLHWFDPGSATDFPLVETTTSFKPPRRGEIPHVDVTRDVNRDGRDDLVLPGDNGFRILLQTSKGAFADPVSIGPSADMARIYGADGYRYDPWSQSRIHEVDYNRDGRSDLVWWNEDHFEVHFQDEHGLFDPEAERFTTDVACDSDNLDSLTLGDMTGKVLHSLADLNGDGVADLVVYSLEGKSIAGKQSTYEIHFGAPAPDGSTAFTRGADIAFQSHGRVQFGMDLHDLDRDGLTDLMIFAIETRYLESSLWKRFKGFMGDDIWLDLEFYRNDGGRFPATPNTIRRIALGGVPSHREPGWVPLDILLRGGLHERRNAQTSYLRAFNPTLLIGDVTGDGRSDLLIGDHPRIVDVSVGVPGPDLFDRRPQEVAVALPNDEEYNWLVDLNRDGKQDILMHHPFTLRDAHGARKWPPGTEPHRVTILTAR